MLKFNNLKKLKLNDNQLHGEIPSLEGMVRLQVRTRDGLETRTKLKQCLILRNFGSFVFLGAEFLVISVQELSLARNNLEGAIPKTLGELRSISKLYLEGNKLNGTIPPERGAGGNRRVVDSYGRSTLAWKVKWESVGIVSAVFCFEFTQHPTRRSC